MISYFEMLPSNYLPVCAPNNQSCSKCLFVQSLPYSKSIVKQQTPKIKSLLFNRMCVRLFVQLDLVTSWMNHFTS